MPSGLTPMLTTTKRQRCAIVVKGIERYEVRWHPGDEYRAAMVLTRWALTPSLSFTLGDAARTMREILRMAAK